MLIYSLPCWVCLTHVHVYFQTKYTQVVLTWCVAGLRHIIVHVWILKYQGFKWFPYIFLSQTEHLSNSIAWHKLICHFLILLMLIQYLCLFGVLQCSPIKFFPGSSTWESTWPEILCKGWFYLFIFACKFTVLTNIILLHYTIDSEQWTFFVREISQKCSQCNYTFRLVTLLLKLITSSVMKL